MSKTAAENKTAVIGQPAQNFDGFESSVLDAAKLQAQQIIDNAKRESDEIYEKRLSGQKGDPVAEHRTETQAAYRRKVAAAKQKSAQQLLVYRKQLVNGLFAEAEEKIEAFTKTDAYADFLVSLLRAHAEEAADGCTVLLRAEDLKHKNAIAKLLPKAEFEADASIRLGGAKLRVGRILYDETLVERLCEERKAFVARCGLRVDTAGLGGADEAK